MIIEPNCFSSRCRQHLLDNDRVQDDLKRQTLNDYFEVSARDRFWAILEELFNRFGLPRLSRRAAAIPGRASSRYSPAVHFVVPGDYPFANRL